MLTPLTDRIFRVKLPHHSQYVNSYLIEGEKGFTVLDTGYPTEAGKQIWQKLAADGFVFEKVVITHGHTDHLGLASWFQRQLRVPVIHSAIGYEWMKTKRRKAREAEKTGGFAPSAFLLRHDGPRIPEWFLHEQAASADFEPDGVFGENDCVTFGDWPFRPILTTGHAPDHFCFWNEERRILFVGDHVLGDTTTVVPSLSEDAGNPLHEYLEGLRILETFEPELALPGHGEPLPDLRRRIAELREGHFRRLRQIADLLARGSKTAGQISREIYGGKSSGLLAALETAGTISRLGYMESTGKIKRAAGDDGKIYFSFT